MEDCNSTNVNFGLAAVPEPSTYAALCGALALAGTALFRRKSRLAA